MVYGKWPIKLYHCNADDHYHVIIGPENFSWPFWSLEAGMYHVEFAKGGLLKDEVDQGEIKRVLHETTKLEAAIWAAARFPNRAENGRFAPGFRMPLKMRLYERGSAAQSWLDFFTGEVDHIYYADEEGFRVPLYCDFVRRDTSKPTEFPRDMKKCDKLALAKAWPVSMKELGIEI